MIKTNETNETNETNIKYGALFYNRSGNDKCYGRVSGSSDSQIIAELCSMVDFAEGTKDEYEVVAEYYGSIGGKIKLYSFDGIGIYIGDYEDAPDEGAARYEVEEMGLIDFDEDDRKTAGE